MNSALEIRETILWAGRLFLGFHQTEKSIEFVVKPTSNLQYVDYGCHNSQPIQYFLLIFLIFVFNKTFQRIMLGSCSESIVLTPISYSWLNNLCYCSFYFSDRLAMAKDQHNYLLNPTHTLSQNCAFENRIEAFNNYVDKKRGVGGQYKVHEGSHDKG